VVSQEARTFHAPVTPADEKLLVDYCGRTLHIADAAPGKIRYAQVLMAGIDRISNFTFARNTASFVDQFKMKASMSRKGNCYDNAPIESFWGSSK